MKLTVITIGCFICLGNHKENTYRRSMKEKESQNTLLQNKNQQIAKQDSKIKNEQQKAITG
jgi:hypothetical protein